jgi:hypothetical protein
LARWPWAAVRVLFDFRTLWLVGAPFTPTLCPRMGFAREGAAGR